MISGGVIRAPVSSSSRENGLWLASSSAILYATFVVVVEVTDGLVRD
jgi:hypothetical protein